MRSVSPALLQNILIRLSDSVRSPHDPLSLKTFRGGRIRQASVFPFLEQKGPNSSVWPASLKLATFFRH